MAYKVKKGKENLDIYTSKKISLAEATQKELKELYENHKDLIEKTEDEPKPKKKNKD